MTYTIKEFCGYRLTTTPAEGDTTVTMADLAIFTTFEGRTQGDAALALRAAYSDAELPHFDHDFYDGFWATFADGSQLHYRHN